MRRKLHAALCILAAASTITACGTSFEADESTVYVTKEGTVIGADIEDFNKDYYDGEELEEYITESVENYVASNGDGSIEIDRFKMEPSKDDGITAQLYLNYATYVDYALFKDILFFAGTVKQAQAEGFQFEQDFQAVEDASLAGSVNIQELLTEEGMEKEGLAKEDSAKEGLKAVIIGEETNVKVDGTVQYVSDGNVEVTGKDTARVHYDVEDPEAKPAYILYK